MGEVMGRRNNKAKKAQRKKDKTNIWLYLVKKK